MKTSRTSHNGTIRAQVSQRVLQQAGVLLRGTASDILSELLQNSRRAGAKEVRVRLDPCGTDRTSVTLEDDGAGINDFQNLLCLGDTGWDDACVAAERPAGMGLFSLCNLPGGVTVSSLGTTVHLSQEVFAGRAEAFLMPLSGAALSPGMTTSLRFVMEHGLEVMDEYLRECVLHYPVTVWINGCKAEQQDFLAGAAFVLTQAGCRIGVFDATTPCNRIETNRDMYGSGKKVGRRWLNFFGHDEVSLPVSEPVTLLARLGRSKYHHLDTHRASTPLYAGRLSVMIDVTDHTCVDFVLPGRTEVVVNDKLGRLLHACNEAMFLHVKKACENGRTHMLSHQQWKEAAGMGIKLPQSLARLESATVGYKLHCDCSGSYYWNMADFAESKAGDYRPNITSDSLVSVIDTEELAMLALAMEPAGVVTKEMREAGLSVLYEDNRHMQGYDWYPKGKVLKVSQMLVIGRGKSRQLRQFGQDNDSVTGGQRRPQLPAPGDMPDAIELHVDIQRGSEMETVVIPTWFAFWAAESGDSAVNYAWRVTARMAAACKKDSGSKERLLVKTALNHVFFDHGGGYDDTVDEAEAAFNQHIDEVMAEWLWGGDAKKAGDLFKLALHGCLDDYALARVMTKHNVAGFTVKASADGLDLSINSITRKKNRAKKGAAKRPKKRLKA